MHRKDTICLVQVSSSKVQHSLARNIEVLLWIIIEVSFDMYRLRRGGCSRDIGASVVTGYDDEG